MSADEAAFEGFGQGLTFGFADELEGGVRGPRPGRLRVAARRGTRAAGAGPGGARLRDWHAELGGGLVSSLIPLGAATEAATWGKRALEGAKIGIKAGGIYGLGASEANDLPGAAKDIATGAAAGAVGGGVLGVAIPAAARAGRAILSGDAARITAAGLKAVGPAVRDEVAGTTWRQAADFALGRNTIGKTVKGVQVLGRIGSRVGGAMRQAGLADQLEEQAATAAKQHLLQRVRAEPSRPARGPPGPPPGRSGAVMRRRLGARPTWRTPCPRARSAATCPPSSGSGSRSAPWTLNLRGRRARADRDEPAPPGADAGPAGR